ncbi:hypothetical protein [Erythrobacter sp. Alg231-14]|uniref:hypothetical protein n=1 Tax=Erythrobacter sp. Alg231-14 TaxID=1922225 RepID=UPI000D550323
MAFIQLRQISAGALISNTFIELARIKKEIGIYLAVFTAIAVIAEFAPLGEELGWFPATILYFLGQYYLYREMLTRGGMIVDSRFKVFSLFFMALVLVIPLYLGFTLLFIPGLLLMTKWVMAPAILVSEETHLFDALGASWSLSDNNVMSIGVALFVIGLIWFVIVMVGGTGAGLIEQVVLNIRGANDGRMGPLIWPFLHTLPLLLMGVSVSAYRALNDAGHDMVSVFE